ncbi:hypothetical protein [Klebsiella pasteurii]|uniref:hypothetical protein n=1 Tax=Klebsiella pasteurii TaxID=2587529 RepID=UPI00292FCF36|nr:hypothetical protein [Klebsiella pasteurii]
MTEPTKREIELEMENCQLRNEIFMLSGQLLRYQTAENGIKYESAKRIYTEMTNQKDEGPVIQEKN